MKRHITFMINTSFWFEVIFKSYCSSFKNVSYCFHIDFTPYIIFSISSNNSWQNVAMLKSLRQNNKLAVTVFKVEILTLSFKASFIFIIYWKSWVDSSIIVLNIICCLNKRLLIYKINYFFYISIAHPSSQFWPKIKMYNLV